MRYFRIRNFEKFQHYKDRKPPWVKLYFSLIGDYEFSCLQSASKLQLILLFLLASQHNNRLPVDLDWLQKQLQTKEKINLKALEKHWVEYDASDLLADCKHNAIVETETETYKEEKEKHMLRESWFEQDWKSYPKKNGANKQKAKVCYLKKIKGEEKRRQYQDKTQLYETCFNGSKQYMRNGETWMRNWEDIEVEAVIPDVDPFAFLNDEEEQHVT